MVFVFGRQKSVSEVMVMSCEHACNEVLAYRSEAWLLGNSSSAHGYSVPSISKDLSFGSLGLVKSTIQTK